MNKEPKSVAAVGESVAGGGRLKGLLSLLIGLVIVVFVLFYVFGYVVPPGMMGVRQISFGPVQGFSERGLEAGYHWSIPLYSKIHFVPRTIQVLHLHRDRVQYQNSPGTLEIQTEDGSSVNVDLTLLVKFFHTKSEAHGGPAQLVQQLGTGEEAWNNSIFTVTTNELKESLGKLTTSQFYDPELRQQAVENAHLDMNKRLNAVGINIESVLLRRYTYTEERIDNAIFQKNLQDQEGRLNMARSKLAEAEAALAQVSAEWDAKIKTLQVKGEKTARISRSEADRYAVETNAAADLEVAKAQAEVDKLKAEALATSHGAQVFIGRELAPLLSSLKGGVVSGIDPYDLDKWVERLGVTKSSTQVRHPG